VLSVLSIQLSTDTDFSNDWAIGHGSFMITSFISFLVTVVIYWLSVALRKKEPNQAPEPTSGIVTPRAEPRAAPIPPVAHL
jgi:hypothetical protein